MNNSDLLTAILETLNIGQEDFEKSLALGGITDPEVIDSALTNCEKSVVEGFLNGYITLKRGPKDEGKADLGQSKPPLQLKRGKSVNNVILKKLKIAYALTNDDLMDIFASVGIAMTKNDLTTYFRKEGHKHYRLCDDKLMIKFLEGIALREQ